MMQNVCLKIGSFNNVAHQAETGQQISLTRLELHQKMDRVIDRFFAPDKELFLLTVSWQDDLPNDLFSPFHGETFQNFQIKYMQNNSRWIALPKLSLTKNWAQNSKINLLFWVIDLYPKKLFPEEDLKKLKKFLKSWTWPDKANQASLTDAKDSSLKIDPQLLEKKLFDCFTTAQAIYKVMEFAEEPNSGQLQQKVEIKNEYLSICLNYI